jgi:hypothetical protein
MLGNEGEGEFGGIHSRLKENRRRDADVVTANRGMEGEVVI